MGSEAIPQGQKPVCGRVGIPHRQPGSTAVPFTTRLKLTPPYSPSPLKTPGLEGVREGFPFPVQRPGDKGIELAVRPQHWWPDTPGCLGFVTLRKLLHLSVPRFPDL